MSALLDGIRLVALSRPDQVAVQDDAGYLTYGALAAEVAVQASLLNGLVGDTAGPVGIDLDNSIAWVLADLAILSLGRASVPLPSFFTSAQRAAALHDAGAVAIVHQAGIALLHNPPIALPTGCAKISYTSGSTGAPKGICLAEQGLLATAEAIVQRFGQKTAVRHLALLPLGVLLENVAGLYASLLAGGSYFALSAASIGMARPFAPDFETCVDTIISMQATSLILVPELLAGLVATLERRGTKLPSLELVAVGGARISMTLLARAEALGLPVVQGYGLTECCSVVSIEARDETVRGGVGQPLDHVFISLADDGEIIVEGELYLGNPGAPRARGAYATGDLGRIDAAGRLSIIGRKSNLIITSHGRNISPEWVEGVLVEKAGIAQVIVHGEGAPALSAWIVSPASAAIVEQAIADANETLPDYARIVSWRRAQPFTPADGTLTANGRPRRSSIHHREAQMPFFDQLTSQTAEARQALLAVPQLRAGLAGRVNRETYIAYLAQAYHHVSHTVPLMREARDRLSRSPMLVRALDDYIADEIGHEQWILDDIEAAGGNPDRAKTDGPSAATSLMVDHAYRTIREGNPAAFFGMVFVLESTSIALAQVGASALQASLGLPSNALRYLTSHGALDQEHMRFFERTMNGIDDIADREAIVVMAREVFGLFAAMFAAIPMEMTDEVA